MSNLGRRDSEDSSVLDNNVINISTGEQNGTFSRTSSGLDQKSNKQTQHRGIIPPIRGPPRVRMQTLSALSDNSSFQPETSGKWQLTQQQMTIKNGQVKDIYHGEQLELDSNIIEQLKRINS